MSKSTKHIATTIAVAAVTVVVLQRAGVLHGAAK
jgi:hypothetical protein